VPALERSSHHSPTRWGARRHGYGAARGSPATSRMALTDRTTPGYKQRLPVFVLPLGSQSFVFASLRHLLGAMPDRAVVVDVSARDGLQSEPDVLPAPTRAAWVRSILEAGVPEAEAGSFVDHRRLPQMSDTRAVLGHLEDLLDRLWVLVPNLRGLEAAHEAGARRVVCLVSATETHSHANLGRPIRRVLADMEHLAAHSRTLRIEARVAVSMAWVDPEEGVVPPGRVVEICEELHGMGFTAVTLCDTYGGASPLAVAELIEGLAPLFPPHQLGLHLHDTLGAASANVLVGLAAGVTRFDGSIGGLGGCPFAPGARGNMATEHLVHLLSGLGVETGIDPLALGRCVERCLAELRRATPAGPGACDNPDTDP